MWENDLYSFTRRLPVVVAYYRSGRLIISNGIALAISAKLLDSHRLNGMKPETLANKPLSFKKLNKTWDNFLKKKSRKEHEGFVGQKFWKAFRLKANKRAKLFELGSEFDHNQNLDLRNCIMHGPEFRLQVGNRWSPSSLGWVCSANFFVRIVNCWPRQVREILLYVWASQCSLSLCSIWCGLQAVDAVLEASCWELH